MSNIWEMTNTALSTLGVTVAASALIQATPTADLPDTYITYQVIDMTPEQHADNAETLRSELVQVNIHKRAGLMSLPDVIGAMTAAGFFFYDGREIEYDAVTRHFGIALDFEYLRDLNS